VRELSYFPGLIVGLITFRSALQSVAADRAEVRDKSLPRLNYKTKKLITPAKHEPRLAKGRAVDNSLYLRSVYEKGNLAPKAEKGTTLFILMMPFTIHIKLKYLAIDILHVYFLD